MNLVTQLATQILMNKDLLIQLFQTLNFSSDFIKELRRNHIYVAEERIRYKMRLLCNRTQNQSFKDLCCHDNGIRLVFHMALRNYRWIRFRVSFDIKILEIILNNHQQSMIILINGIQIKSLNFLSRPFRYCMQLKVRTLVTDELERLCVEQSISYERLFKDINHPLAYRINLSKLKELDQLREQYFLIGNRSILDLIQITYVEHREQAIILNYRFKETTHRRTTIASIRRTIIDKGRLSL